MVSADKILQTAIDEGANLIGLSGLITPSLDEMVHVAKEMTRRKHEIPLLIGGATTSRQHTAIRIAPCYEHPTVHVLDASRAVGVVSKLMVKKARQDFVAELKQQQDRLRVLHGSNQRRKLLSYAEAVARKPSFPWDADTVSTPKVLGRRELIDFPLEEIIPYIDWTFFFSAWELKGRFPQILKHPTYGEAAQELYDHGKRLLADLVEQHKLKANGVYGLWPAHSDGDDIVLFKGDTRKDELVRFSMLRQQGGRDGQPCLSLADFVAPHDSGVKDYVGAFAVTAGLGADELTKSFEDQLDDYSAIMVKALADRLAEAFAELLHARVRREWGYTPTESLSNDELIAERYRGIRPAFGYPACPDHTEKVNLFRLLEAEKVDITLTENQAIMPGASVAGIYLAHPQARYFSLGRIALDQVVDYAGRRKVPVASVEQWLRPHLGYEPGDSSTS